MTNTPTTPSPLPLASGSSAKPASALSARLSKHFAAGAVATVLASAAPAHAAIISTSTNIAIPATTAGVYLNVLNGAFSGTPAAVPGWDVNPFSSSSLSLFGPNNPAGGKFAASGGLSKLALGITIDSLSTFSTGRTGLDTQWALNSADNLVGFRFLNENTSQIHYGWLRIQLGATTIAARSITQYAYESVAGTGIQAGAVPEPGTLTLVAAGAFLFGRRRRR